jgi:tripartite-type tricarboxylate transporter receptor subunit TctC
MAEYLPGYEASIYVGIAAPRGTSSDIVEQLNKTTNLAFADAMITRRITDLGDAPLSLSSAEFAKLVTDETEKWRKVIAAGNIRAE